MKEHQHVCTLIEFSWQEISDEEKQLIEYAEAVLNGAYAPYSEFKVGAAVLLSNGMMIKGSNQENAAYPSGLCAERVALFSAASQYPNEKMKSIAVTTSGHLKEPVAPCGACRQVMMEYEMKQHQKIKIILTNPDRKIYVSESVENILPLMFKLESGIKH